MDNSSKDYFFTAYRNFRALAWLDFLFFIFGVIEFISESYGRTPSPAIIIWMVQTGIMFALLLIASRLFKKKSNSAVTMGYTTLAIIFMLNILVFYLSPVITVTGLLSIVIFIYLLYIVFKAQKQAKQ